MADRQQQQDSRRCKRYRVREGKIALDSVFGELIDISFGGLSFRYTAYEDLLQKPREFGIIFGGETLYFEHIPLESVNDFELGEENGMLVRRRCMRFGALSHADLVRLARFIRCHGDGEEG